MASGYKTLPTHVIERVMCGCNYVLMYFVVVTLLFQLLAKHSSAALPCKRFVDKLICPSLWLHHTTPHSNQLALQL